MQHDDSDIHVPAGVLKNWQEIADILADITQVPAALIMRYTEPVIDVFVSSNSDGNPYHPGDKEHLPDSGLYCETVINTRDRLLVPDATADPDWQNNPDIKLNMISYMGLPILLPNRRAFGTLCVLDNQANAYSRTTEKLMAKFRNLIESHLEVLYMNQMLGEDNKRLSDYLDEIRVLRGLVPICANCKNIRDERNVWHPVENYLSRHPDADFSHSICPACRQKLYGDL